jgi:hypothetical protein
MLYTQLLVWITIPGTITISDSSQPYKCLSKASLLVVVFRLINESGNRFYFCLTKLF